MTCPSDRPVSADEQLIAAVTPMSAPAGAALAMHVRTRRDMVEKLRKRADWLRSEYLNGGNFEHLHAREQECRAIAEMIEEQRL